MDMVSQFFCLVGWIFLFGRMDGLLWLPLDKMVENTPIGKQFHLDAYVCLLHVL